MQQQTCEYCPFFEYNYCTWQNSRRKKNQIICQDALLGFEIPEDAADRPIAGVAA